MKNQKIDFKEKFSELRESHKEKFKNISENKSDEWDKKVISLIKIVQARIDEWNANRNNSLNIALGILAFSIVGLAALISGITDIPILIMIIFVPPLLILLITSVVMFRTNIIQTRFYFPFIEVAETWKWFYLYTIDKGLPYKTKLKKEEFEDSIRIYLKDLNNYTARLLNLTAQENLAQDIEQLFLYITYEGYLTRFSLKLSKILYKGIKYSLITLLFILGGIFIYYILDYFCLF